MRDRTPDPTPERESFTFRMKPIDWQRLREIRATLKSEVGEPSEADAMRWALKEAHAARCNTKEPKQ